MDFYAVYTQFVASHLRLGETVDVFLDSLPKLSIPLDGIIEREVLKPPLSMVCSTMPGSSFVPLPKRKKWIFSSF